MRQTFTVAISLFLATAAARGESVLRAGAGVACFVGGRGCAHAQISAGFGRRITGPIEADADAEVTVRPFGYIPARVSVNVEDTLILIPLGLRASSPVLARRWRLSAGAGATLFVYHAGNFFPGVGSSASFQKLGWHALGSASFALTADGRFRLAATPRFTAYNGRGLLNRVFSFTGGVEWRF